jgi:hypothetical protein
MKSKMVCGVVGAAGLAWTLACGGSVNSDLQARQAYQGLDEAIQKCMTLGFAGFTAANNANIPAQSTDGGLTGTLTVSGQVDQGSSANKGMRLDVAMDNYSDGEVTIDDNPAVAIAYRTDAGAPPQLDMQLKNIPDGTFTGTLAGVFEMDGDLEGVVQLDLAMSGNIQDAGPGVIREPGTTTITGTAKSGSGEYQVNVTR